MQNLVQDIFQAQLGGHLVLAEEDVVDVQQEVRGVDGPVGPGLQDARDARAEAFLLHARRHARPRRVALAHYLHEPLLEPGTLYTYVLFEVAPTDKYPAQSIESDWGINSTLR